MPDEGEIDDKPKASIGDDELEGEEESGGFDGGGGGNRDVINFEPGRVDVDPDQLSMEDR